MPATEPDERVGVTAGGVDDRGNFLREVNTIIEQIAERVGTDGTSWEFLCECGRRGCRETVELTLEEYDDLTAHGFLHARKHRTPDAA